MTKTISSSAHRYYLDGTACLARGHYLDAQVLFTRACQLDPQNADYRFAREKLAAMAFSFLKKDDPRKASVDPSQCTQNCCEGCGECCGEGCCESICENADCCNGCDGCDCDCG